ncbi:duf1620 domain-containing protein [Phlyctema vagabunda]|uniref:Duf1620 domain-containing protein n=1 Tax=Phlyctema vagabunda TaxID=108571 RepID=A0ABR4P635_9HELO
MLLTLPYLLAAAAVFTSSLTDALAFSAPSATSAADVEGKLLRDGGITPRPTEAPKLPFEELRRRQNAQKVFVAGDNTCGYISGRAGAEFRCPSTDSCVLIPVTGTAWGAVGCCSGSECGIRRGCVDYEAYHTASACDKDCQQDAFIQKCTAAAAPYCNRIKFPIEGVVDYFCDSVTVSSFQLASTTYSGQRDRAMSTVDFPSSLPFPTTDFSPFAGTPAAAEPTPTSTPGVEEGDSVIAVEDSSDNSTPYPTGAIVGTVVGGAVAITILALLAFFIFRKKTRSKGYPFTLDPRNYHDYAGSQRSREGSTGSRMHLQHKSSRSQHPSMSQHIRTGV